MNNPNSSKKNSLVATFENLTQEFFQRDTRIVAIELLGKYLVHEIDDTTLVGKIVETEAYLGEIDPACHMFTGYSKRNSVFDSPGGTAYVYLIYGKYHCLNVITDPPFIKGAVLIRALEPIFGIHKLVQNRHISSVKEVTNGPGKLTQAFHINMKYNNSSLLSGQLTIQQEKFSQEPSHIGVSTRIGISKARNWKLRYFILNNSFVSGNKKIYFETLTDVSKLVDISYFRNQTPC